MTDTIASSNGHLADIALPAPETTRFIPLRAGIVGLWQYDDQEFWFHRGRVMLRGENGMGKSKALEVGLPFLFDADLRPERLDPFGDRARTMRWNLLGEDGRSGLGYSWLEFGRTDPSGGARFVSIGAGVRATASTADVDVWYFIAHGRRGVDFELLDDGRVPHTKDRLRVALEGIGTVYDTKSRYRQAVDATLFDLGAERYAALIELLLQLRRPQLSKTLDPVELSRLLTISLPPLDAAKVERLADALESLERIDAEIEGLRKSHSMLEAFLEEYRGYAAVEARRLGARVRHSASRLYEVSRRENQGREELTATQEEIRRIELARADNAQLRATARAELRALENSESMKNALTLQRLKDSAEVAAESARRAAASADRAQQTLARRTSERAQAEAVVEEVRAGLDAAAGAARVRADEARLGDRHAAHEAAIVSDPLGARDGALGAVEERRGALRRLNALADAVADSGRVVADREHSCAASRDEADDARTAVARASATVERACETFHEEVGTWRAGLTVLELSDDAVERLLEAACAPEGWAAATDIVTIAMWGATEPLVAERARLRAETNSLADEIAELSAERTAVEQGRDEGPGARRLRPWREDMAGAPLWRLCDFAPELGETERAALEAALEDAGLLDAWITPRGRVLDPETLDAFLIAAPGDGATLRDVLVPEPDAPVPAVVIDSVLRSVAVGATGRHRVGLDGSWALGPLEGRSAKQGAEHIGAAARARTRAARIAELDRRLAGLRRRADDANGYIAELDRRLVALDAERRGFPSGAGIGAARADERAAVAAVDAADTRVAAAEQRLAAAELEQTEANGALRAEADRWGLAGEVGRLDELAAALERYRDALVELIEGARRAAEADLAHRRAVREEDEAADVARGMRTELDEARPRAAEIAAEVRVLEETAGAEVKEILARIDAVNATLASLEAEARDLERGHGDLIADRARAQERLEGAARERAEREQQRNESAERFAALAVHSLLGLALDGFDLDAPWNVTRALDAARAVHGEWGDEPSEDEMARSQTSLFNFFTELQRDLPSDFDVSAERPASLFVVAIGFNARRYEVPELVAFLNGELEIRRRAFEAEERKVIEDFILKELGLHLQERISDAAEMIAEMNTQLKAHPTASGMRLELRWKPKEAEIGGIGDALRLLRKDLALMVEREVEGLVSFLRERIEQARADEGTGRYAEHLAAALDYREWFAFEVVQHKDGRVETLTRKRHARGSGGEKSVAMHLPLFAAAAAHYRSAAAYAPRLIMLDEAFAGIDQNMRGSCMALLQAFDLDFMMTSHDEWGFHPQIDGLATYQLTRAPDLPSVAAVRFVWNGRGARQEDPLFGAEETLQVPASPG